MLMTLRDRMNVIYREGEVPWDLPEPPDILVELVESGRISPCEAVDLGCGTGNQALWLASRGFRVTGIDLSTEAIAIASGHAKAQGLACRFLARNLTDDVEDLAESFDFAYDWKVLHHVFPDQRPHWVANVRRMLRPGGTYLSLCFSEREPTGFPGSGKVRETALGTTIYLSSEEELAGVFAPHFAIESITTVVVPGKSHSHAAVRCLMTKPSAR
jgi:2-polyprenyl-3-methyl-5-hydroxy-6-metoxy-1,4-benzoquinol methylase